MSNLSPPCHEVGIHRGRSLQQSLKIDLKQTPVTKLEARSESRAVSKLHLGRTSSCKKRSIKQSMCIYLKKKTGSPTSFSPIKISRQLSLSPQTSSKLIATSNVRRQRVQVRVRLRGNRSLDLHAEPRRTPVLPQLPQLPRGGNHHRAGIVPEAYDASNTGPPGGRGRTEGGRLSEEEPV